jgi:urease gamma subunit
MIHVKATVSGEPDMPEFMRVFDYATADEEIFFRSAAMLQENLQRGMKLNVSGALTVYCNYVVKCIRAGRLDDQIQDGAPRILSVDNVMIGVPETLRIIRFEAEIDNNPARVVTFKEPIPTSNYILAG